MVGVFLLNNISNRAWKSHVQYFLTASITKQEKKRKKTGKGDKKKKRKKRIKKYWKR